MCEARQADLATLRRSAMRLFHFQLAVSYSKWAALLDARRELAKAARGFTHREITLAWRQWAEITGILKWVQSILSPDLP